MKTLLFFFAMQLCQNTPVSAHEVFPAKNYFQDYITTRLASAIRLPEGTLASGNEIKIQLQVEISENGSLLITGIETEDSNMQQSVIHALSGTQLYKDKTFAGRKTTVNLILKAS